MALSYGFYNSMGGDRRYNAVQISELFDGLITDGVFSSIDDILATVPGEGLQVIVKSGRAWFNHTWNKNDAPVPFNLATPDMTLSRFDTIVLEVNSDISVRANKFAVVKGTPATTPQKPALINTETLHQHPLAYVRVRGGATQIEQTDIEILVGKDECPFTTGILTSASIEDLFQQWEGDFYAWWDTIKTTLDENIVTNLLNMIDQRVKISDKATAQEVYDGVDDTKWMTPAKVKSAATNIVNNIMTSTTRTVKLFNRVTTTAALSIEIPFGRPITDFEELNISIAGIMNNQGARVRLNNISEACYMRGTSASLQKHCTATAQTAYTRSNILTIKLIPSRSNDFYYNYVTGSARFCQLSQGTTQTAISEEPFIYDPLLGMVDPNNITYMTITTDNLTNSFASGIQISAWGILREQEPPLDIPIVEMPYIQNWTEFVNDVSNTNLTQELFNIGNAYGRIQRFTSNASFNAVKNRKYKALLVSGGGGGASGRANPYVVTSGSGALTGYVYGGKAGDPGQIKTGHLILPADYALAVTVGALGVAGGTALSSDIHNPGTSGGSTSIGSLISAFGGSGGVGGSSTMYYLPPAQTTASGTALGGVGVTGWTSYLNESFGAGGKGGDGTANKVFNPGGPPYYEDSWSGGIRGNPGNNGTPGIAFIMW